MWGEGGGRDEVCVLGGGGYPGDAWDAGEAVLAVLPRGALRAGDTLRALQGEGKGQRENEKERERIRE